MHFFEANLSQYCQIWFCQSNSNWTGATRGASNLISHLYCSSNYNLINQWSRSSIFNQEKKIKFQQGGYATRIKDSPSVHSSLLKWYYICQSYSCRFYNSSTGMVVSFFLHFFSADSEIGKNPDNLLSSLFSGLLCMFFSQEYGCDLEKGKCLLHPCLIGTLLKHTHFINFLGYGPN